MIARSDLGLSISEGRHLAQECPAYSLCTWLLYYELRVIPAMRDWSMYWRSRRDL